METETLQARADAGDVEAMLDLAERCSQRGDLDEAMEWTDRAAETGDPNGQRRAIMLHTLFMNDAVRAKRWDDIRCHAHTVCIYYLDMIADQRGDLTALYRDARYYYAAAVLMQKNGDIRRALTFIEHAADPRDRLLHQALLAMSDDADWPIDEALSCLRDNRYMRAEKNGVEEFVIGVAAICVSSEMEQRGHTGRAARLLDAVMTHLRDEDALRGLRQERAHYHWRLLGGWRYDE